MQQYEEEMPHEKQISIQEERIDVDVIKEQQAQIHKLKDDLTKENHMMAFLKQENRLLKVSLMQHDTSQGHPSSSKAKDKGKVVIGLEE